MIDEFKFDEIKTKNVKAMLDSVGAKKALVVMGSKNDNLVLSAYTSSIFATASLETTTVSYFKMSYTLIVLVKAVLTPGRFLADNTKLS